MKIKYLIILLFCFCWQFCGAQSFKLMRYDEDYSHLKDSARTFYNTLKFIPISASGSTFLSLGGEARLEVDRVQNEDWGARGIGRNIFMLQRYNLHADLHIGKKVRIFSQLRSGLENGRKNGPRPIDEDQLNIQNLFVDVTAIKTSDKMLNLRLGRQELQYGSGRLIDVREGPNLRNYFDGVKLAYSSTKLTIDGLLMADGRTRPGVMDNPRARKPNLWGIYSTMSPLKILNVDLYYLGIRRDQFLYDEGSRPERRHTFGARLWKNNKGLIYNFEIGVQRGEFGGDRIKAWGGSSELGYRFGLVKGFPTLKLRSDFISGDDEKGDGKLGTFSPLYPNGGYFGMNPQAGPANLLSLHPSLGWSPLKDIVVTMELVMAWRESANDGIYRPDGSLNLSSSGSEEKYIGTTYLTSLSWGVNRYLNVNVGVQYFRTGRFLNDVIPGHKDGFFATTVIGFKF